jgi:fructose PTS system EIIBC or EIIC component
MFLLAIAVGMVITAALVVLLKRFVRRRPVAEAGVTAPSTAAETAGSREPVAIG